MFLSNIHIILPVHEAHPSSLTQSLLFIADAWLTSIIWFKLKIMPGFDFHLNKFLFNDKTCWLQKKSFKNISFSDKNEASIFNTGNEIIIKQYP